jgi:hypothetical protein
MNLFFLFGDGVSPKKMTETASLRLEHDAKFPNDGNCIIALST